MPDAPTVEQPELFAVETVAGYARLGAKERLFAQALFDGCTQREAIKRAGVTGSPEVLDVAASKMVRTAKVQAVMNQAWARSGASIDDTLRQAAELQRRAFAEATGADSAIARKTAFQQWREASALIASIHGKLSMKVEHSHSGEIGVAVTVPADALPVLAGMRRDVLVARRDGMLPACPSTGGSN